MAWSPKYIDKPLRFIFDPEIWMVVPVALFILNFILQINQLLAGAIGVVIAFFLQRITDRNSRGFIVHSLFSLGIFSIFPKYGKYRF